MDLSVSRNSLIFCWKTVLRRSRRFLLLVDVRHLLSKLLCLTLCLNQRRRRRGCCHRLCASTRAPATPSASPSHHLHQRPRPHRVASAQCSHARLQPVDQSQLRMTDPLLYSCTCNITCTCTASADRCTCRRRIVYHARDVHSEIKSVFEYALQNEGYSGLLESAVRTVPQGHSCRSLCLLVAPGEEGIPEDGHGACPCHTPLRTDQPERDCVGTHPAREGHHKCRDKGCPHTLNAL